MKRLFIVLLLLSVVFSTTSCSNLRGASRASASLSSFLGFSELPDWYITNKYTYKDSRWLDNDFGLPIHYRDVGEGPVVVLLHGEISSLHTWEKWIEVLSKDYRVIAVDLPGAGLTGAPTCLKDSGKTCSGNLSPDYIQHTFEYFIEDLKLQKFTLVGNSYGGYLATQYALDHPGKIDKLVLISPMGYQQEIPWILNYVTASGMDVFNRFVQPSIVVSTIVDDLYGERQSLKRSNLDRYVHLAQTQGAHHCNVIQLQEVRNIMERGMPFSPAGINAKTLIMWGEYDTWGDASHATRWEEEIKDTILVRYPFYGHVLMEEAPDQTIVDIVAFLGDQPLPTLEGLGTGGTFTIEEADAAMDKEALFGTKSMDNAAPQKPAEPEATEEMMMDDAF